MIPLQFPPYALILFCSAAMQISIALYALRMRSEKPYLYFGIAFLILGSWPLLYGVELLIADTSVSIYLAKFRAIPFQVFPVFFNLGIYHLVKRKTLPKWILYTLSGLAAVQIFAMSTTDIFFNVWAESYAITTSDGFNIHVLMPGAWLGFTLIFYHFFSDAIALAVLFKGIKDYKQPFKMQFSVLAAAIIISLLLTIPFTFRMISFGPYNPIPASLLISSAVFAVAMFKYKLLSIIPYAKESVFDIIQNPVLIVDKHEKLIDFNPQAKQLFRLNSSMIGDSIQHTFELLNMDWTILTTDEPVIIETRWGTGNNYKFSTLKKELKKQDMSGYIVVFSDITVQLNAMENKHQTEILTYKESILGDMHDGIGGVVATAAILAQSALEDEETSEKDRKIKQIAELLENGSFELRSMLNILDKEEIDWTSLVHDMRSFSSTVLDARDIGRKFSVEGKPYSSQIDFDKYLSIFRLFKEIITNIIKHSQATHVSITLSFLDDKFRLTVADNGIGMQESKMGGYGLKNMKKRVENLKGTVEITSKDGTTVVVNINTQY
jgi:signal transduction histidine kinase